MRTSKIGRVLLKEELPIARMLLRIALSASLLSAVADRFGLWGAPGQPTVAWGSFSKFLTYTAVLNPWCPVSLIPILGWFVSIAETLLGIGLLVGFRLRLVAQLTSVMTMLFALAMTFNLGVHAPLNYSVFVCSAATFLLSAVAEIDSEQT